MILFIDDEPEYISAFAQAFELTDFEVSTITNLDEAWEYLKENKDEVDAIILDVMMPPGKLLNLEETANGLRSGIIFLEYLKELDEGIPVIILTNANKKNIEKISHRNYFIYEKKEIDPWSLVDKMDNIKRRTKFND